MIHQVVIDWYGGRMIISASDPDVDHITVTTDSNEVPVAVNIFHGTDGHTTAYTGFRSVEIFRSII